MTERFEVNQGYNDRYIYDNLHQNILGQNRVCAIMNELDTKCSRLEKENERLKRTISKIDFAIIRKYDNSLENFLDEVYDGEYNKWIKKQLSRAKKLDGDDGE